MTRIEKEAEEKYPLNQLGTTDYDHLKYVVNKNCIDAYIAGALSEQTRSKRVVDCLKKELEIYEAAVKIAAKEKDTETIVKEFIPRINEIKQALAEYEGENE